MRAFALKDFESQPSIMNLPNPEPGPGEVLVRVRASSLNGIDLATAGGMLQGMIDFQFPVVLGKDFAGTVEATGPGANLFAVGDPVFGVVFNPTPLNTRSFAEFLAVPETLHITHIPGGLDVSQAGALGLAGTAALQAVEAVLPAAGETILISGATGGVGSIALQLAAARGATVIATAKPGKEAEFVRGLGAAHAVDYTGDLAKAVREIRPEGVDAAIDLAGDAMVLADLLVPNGRLSSTLGVGPDQLENRSVAATSVMANPEVATLERLVADVVAGRLRIPIQQTYSLEDAGQAMAAFGSGTLGKLGITLNKPNPAQ
jgi:NADPH:quinone reductase-like Zn-dependent oxidoreductase